MNNQLIPVVDLQRLVREAAAASAPDMPLRYRHFLQTGATPRLPHTVSIETTSACQLACPMCDREHMQRETALMSDEVFHAVVAAIAPHGIRLSFNGIGEPLLDRKLPERIAYARAQGIEHAALNTNGMLLDKRRSRELIEAGLTGISVSLDGADQASLEAGHLGADYATVVRNLEDLLDLKREMGAEWLEVMLRVTVQQANLAALPDIYRRWHGRVSRIRVNLAYQYGAATTAPVLPYRWEERIPCPQVLGSLLVLTNGDATLCCLGDINAELAVGNLARDGLAQCYAGPRAQEVRALHRSGDLDAIPVCQRCAGSTMSNFECGSVARTLEEECLALVARESGT